MELNQKISRTSQNANTFLKESYTFVLSKQLKNNHVDQRTDFKVLYHYFVTCCLIIHIKNMPELLEAHEQEIWVSFVFN